MSQPEPHESTTSLTYEQVAAAAENLVHRGAEPSLQRVCEHLGGGSPSRIQRHLSAWRAARPEPVPPTPRLPEDLIQALERELAEQVASARGPGEQAAEEARGDATTLAEVGEALERRLAELEKRLQDSEAARDAAVSRRDALKAEVEQLTTELGSERRSGREHHVSLIETRQQVTMLKEQLESAQQARLDAERQVRAADEERVKALRSQAVAETQRDSALGQAAEKTDQLAQLQRELQGERTRQRQEVAELRAEHKERLDAAERARQDALKQAQEATQRATKAEIRAEALQATQTALKSRMDALQVQQRQRSAKR